MNEVLSKKELTEALYLSCVENYFLAWLGRYYSVEKLYGASFLGLSQVFDDFSFGATYENYCAIPRLQDVAEEYGIVRHEYIACDAAKAVKIIKMQPPETLCLARVNTNFFIGYKRASWREDHYICIDSELNWINQYPLSEGQFSYEQFCGVYDGAVCIYRTADLQAVPPDQISREIAAQEFSDIRLPGRLGSIESAIGVLRVTRKRLVRYYAEYEKAASLLQSETSLLDEIYFMLRLKAIKEKQVEEKDKALLRAKTMEALQEPLQNVFESEKRLAEVIKNGS